MVSDHLFFEGIRERPREKRGAPCSRSRGVDSATPERAVAFFRRLFDAVGLPIEAYRSHALNRRAAACLRFLRVPDLEAAWRKIEARPELAVSVVSVVLLGVTEFCRDRAVFEHLHEEVMDDLARMGRPLRVWSAACSDGHELYSIAILLNEAGLLEGAHLLGTDVREDAICQARSGEFTTDALEKLDGDWRARHFIPGGRGATAIERLREGMHWKQADLLSNVEPGPWDLVLWRNMAIYLETRAAERVWTALLRELTPGGYLVTGKADHPPRMASLVKVAPCIYRKEVRA